jgi:peptidoglycan/LPS O-acetylase OafA/YrhL
MGAYRYILAVLVALSHSVGFIQGWDTGVVAVISFFLLSGYVMTVLVEKHYSSIERIPGFYLDRAARLFPQFLFYLLVAAVSVYALGVNNGMGGGDHYTSVDWVLNIFMLPLGYNFWGQVAGIDFRTAIAPTWSLGLELTFYIMVPWVLLLSKSSARIIVPSMISMVVFVLAFMGWINTDIFGYRLLCGNLFVFLVGASFYYGTRALNRFILFVWLGSVTTFILVMSSDKLYQLHWNKEVNLGLLLGIPMVWVLHSKRFSSIDEFLGNMSYGIFLNHLLIIPVMIDKFGIPVIGHEVFTDYRWANFLILMIVSNVLSFITYHIIELPALRWRRRIREASAAGQGRVSSKAAGLGT